MDEIPPVNRSMLETTLLETPCTPPTIVLAKAAPGRVGMVRGVLVPCVDLGAETV